MIAQLDFKDIQAIGNNVIETILFQMLRHAKI
jgi:hypothetical protein